MKDRNGTARRSKLRIVRIVLTEIIVMALGVVCCIMPMPWRLIVPIIIGTRSILIKAHMYFNENQGSSKLRVVRIVLTEIIVMALGVVCCIMPMPWRLIVPIIIGTRSILIKAHMRMKEPLPQDEMKYSAAEPKKESKRDERKARKTTGKETSKKGNKKAA